MASWLDDLRLWIPVIGLGAQAAITWWKVGANEARSAKNSEEIASLKEWRAQAREQIHQLQRQLDRSGSGDS